MGRLLEALRVDSANASAANPANLANPAPVPCPRFADSQDSHAAPIEIRGHLLALAADGLLPLATVHRLADADLTACHGCTDSELRAYLRALVQSERMDAGIVPAGYTVAAQCSGCGPVWLWPGAPAHLIACPWCFRRKAGKAIPRPPGS